MGNNGPLSLFWSLLFVLIACFYILRLSTFLVQERRCDPENEIGHGIMALGMAWMLAPAGWLSEVGVAWSSLAFLLAALWFSLRLFTRRPLLTLLPGQIARVATTTLRADAIHVVMYLGMLYMLRLMGNMSLSMSLPAIYLNCLFFLLFAYLLLSYAREISQQLQREGLRGDWFKFGADLAHALMSGAMSWMFIAMLSMTFAMSYS